jgi:hypothetical protein
MSAVASTAVEQAQLSGKKLPQPLVVNTMANAITDRINTASNQQNLLTSFNSLLDKVGILLTVGNEVAKVRLLLYSYSFHHHKMFKDASLREFCVASALCRNQGTSDSFTSVLVFTDI